MATSNEMGQAAYQEANPKINGGIIQAAEKAEKAARPVITASVEEESKTITAPKTIDESTTTITEAMDTTPAISNKGTTLTQRIAMLAKTGGLEYPEYRTLSQQQRVAYLDAMSNPEYQRLAKKTFVEDVERTSGIGTQTKNTLTRWAADLLSFDNTEMWLGNMIATDDYADVAEQAINIGAGFLGTAASAAVGILTPSSIAEETFIYGMPAADFAALSKDEFEKKYKNQSVYSDALTAWEQIQNQKTEQPKEKTIGQNMVSAALRDIEYKNAVLPQGMSADVETIYSKILGGATSMGEYLLAGVGGRVMGKTVAKAGTATRTSAAAAQRFKDITGKDVKLKTGLTIPTTAATQRYTNMVAGKVGGKSSSALMINDVLGSGAHESVRQYIEETGDTELENYTGDTKKFSIDVANAAIQSWIENKWGVGKFIKNPRLATKYGEWANGFIQEFSQGTINDVAEYLKNNKTVQDVLNNVANNAIEGGIGALLQGAIGTSTYMYYHKKTIGELRDIVMQQNPNISFAQAEEFAERKANELEEGIVQDIAKDIVDFTDTNNYQGRIYETVRNNIKQTIDAQRAAMKNTIDGSKFDEMTEQELATYIGQVAADETDRIVVNALNEGIALSDVPQLKGEVKEGTFYLEGSDYAKHTAAQAAAERQRIRDLIFAKQQAEKDAKTAAAEAKKAATWAEKTANMIADAREKAEAARIKKESAQQIKESDIRIKELQAEEAKWQKQVEKWEKEYAKTQAKSEAAIEADLKRRTKASIKGGDIEIIRQILQEEGHRTRDLTGTAVKQLAALNWEKFVGKELGQAASRGAIYETRAAIEANVESGRDVLLRAGMTSEQIYNLDDATFNQLVIDRYKLENAEMIAREEKQQREVEEALEQLDVDDIPFQDVYLQGEQFDIADENARLDDINPAYEGDTIVVDGVERTVYNSNGERIAKSEPALRNFWNWFGDSKVVDEDGRPLVVYHGSTKKFEIFDINKSSKESNLGSGFYFTNNIDDLTSNYEGGGVDFDNRIDRIAEQIEQEEGVSWEEAKEKAYNQEFEGEFRYATYLKLEKPFIIGGTNETVLTYEAKYNEETDEYEEPTGSLIDFAYRFDNELADLGIDDYTFSSTLFERAMNNGGYITATEIDELLSGDEQLGYMLIDYAEESVGQLLSDVVGYEYDGFIDNTVDKKFGSHRVASQKMEGVDESTTHYIAFEPNQIKSTQNRGTFSPDTGDIYFQESPTIDGFVSVNGQTPTLLYSGMKGAKLDEIDPKTMWLSSSQNVALEFLGDSDNSQMFIGFAKSNRPLVVNGRGKPWHLLSLPKELGTSDRKWKTDHIAMLAFQKGYDSVIFKNIKETEKKISGYLFSDKADTIVVKNAKQQLVFEEDVAYQTQKQSGKGGAYDARNRSITLGAKADATTLPHELAHYWIDKNFKYARSGKASQAWMNAWRQVEKYLGIDPEDKVLDKAASEKFARAYERFLGEEKLPLVLAKSMADFRNFVLDHYDFDLDEAKGLQDKYGRPIQLTDEIKQWFNKSWYADYVDASEALMVDVRIEQENEKIQVAKRVEEHFDDVQAEANTPGTKPNDIIREMPGGQQIQETAGIKNDRIIGGGAVKESQGTIGQQIGATYESTSWQIQERLVDEYLASVSVDEAIESLEDDTYPDKIDADFLRGKLIEKLTAEGREDEAARLVMETRETLTEAAQTLQAARALNTPYAAAINQIVQQKAEKLARAKYGNNKNAISKLDAAIDRLIEKYEPMYLDAKDDTERAMVYDTMLSEAARTIGALNKNADLLFQDDEQDIRELKQLRRRGSVKAYRSRAKALLKQKLGLAPSREQLRELARLSSDVNKVITKYRADVRAGTQPVIDPTEVLKAQNELNNYMAAQVGNTKMAQFADATNSFMMANMLWNPATQFKNIVGNTMQMVPHILGSVAKYRNTGTVSMAEKLKILKNAVKIQATTGYNIFSLTDFFDKKTLWAEKYYDPTTAAGKAIRAPLTLLGLSDTVFKGFVFLNHADIMATHIAQNEGKDKNWTQEQIDARAKELFYQALNTDPRTITLAGQKIRSESLIEGEEATFTQDSKTAKFANQFRNILNFGKKTGVGNLLIPFTSTIANIAQDAVGNWTLGIVKEAIKNPKSLFDAVNPLIDKESRKAAWKTIAPEYKNLIKNVLGILMLVYFAATMGDDDEFVLDYNLQTDLDKDIRQNRNAPYGTAVRIGDKWVQIDFLSGAYLPLQTYLTARRHDFTADGWLQGLFGWRDLMPGVGEMESLLKDYQNALKYNKDSDSAAVGELLADQGTEVLTRLIPMGALANQIGNITDETKREKYNRWYDRILGRLPWARESLPESTSRTTGKAIPQTDTWWNLFTGGNVKDFVEADIADVARYEFIDADRALRFNEASSKLKQLGKDTQRYKNAVREVRSIFNQKLAQLSQHPTYKNWDIEQKRKAAVDLHTDVVNQVAERYGIRKKKALKKK